MEDPKASGDGGHSHKDTTKQAELVRESVQEKKQGNAPIEMPLNLHFCTRPFPGLQALRQGQGRLHHQGGDGEALKDANEGADRESLCKVRTET